jgi:uncharacterized protein (TIGR03382 family)
MGIVLAGAVGTIIAFGFLFMPGRFLVLRHVVGFLLAAAVTGILVMWTFDALHPYGSSTRTRMFDYYVALGVIAGIAGPFAGTLAGWLWRRRKRAAS